MYKKMTASLFVTTSNRGTLETWELGALAFSMLDEDTPVFSLIRSDFGVAWDTLYNGVAHTLSLSSASFKVNEDVSIRLQQEGAQVKVLKEQTHCVRA